MRLEPKGGAGFMETDNRLETGDSGEMPASLLFFPAEVFIACMGLLLTYDPASVATWLMTGRYMRTEVIFWLALKRIADPSFFPKIFCKYLVQS